MRHSFEIREAGNQFHGTIVTEGRAASGGRAEVFTVGSVQWPSEGVGILVDHLREPVARAFPRRDTATGAINVACEAVPELREAVESGKRYMSIEFLALQDRTTKGGVREVTRAFVDKAALVEIPEYDTTKAEVRTADKYADPRWRLIL